MGDIKTDRHSVYKESDSPTARQQERFSLTLLAHAIAPHPRPHPKQWQEPNPPQPALAES